MSIGGALRHFRLARGLSMNELAKLANITCDYYRQVESGKHIPSFKTLARIANALEVPLWLIIKEAEEEER